MASYFFQQTPGLGSGGRPARSRRIRTAAQFYADNKQMLEATRAALFSGNSPATSPEVKRKPVRRGRHVTDFKSRAGLEPDMPPGEDAELIQLRKEFQYQQDRLLAWGVFWSELGVRRTQHGKTQSQLPGAGTDALPLGSPKASADPDAKIEDEHSAMGDLVASIMEEIKKLLDQSGRLSHPGRYESAMNLGLGLESPPSTDQNFGGNLTRQQTPPAFGHGSPTMDRKDNPQRDREWQSHELQTGRLVLEQLTNCIDVLYSLVDPREHEGATVKQDGPKGAAQLTHDDANAALMATVHSHPLYIDFPLLQPMHDPNLDGEFSDPALPPPSYDDAQHHTNPQARSIYFYANAQAHVLVDLVAIDPANLPALLLPATEEDKATPMHRVHELADKLSGRGLLSWDGHMKILGFTLAGSRTNSRFGLVYALPAPNDPTALQSYQTLATSLVAGSGYEHEASIPPLENKLRLAYNVVLLATEYLAHGSTHGYIRSNNIVFLREHENPRNLGSSLRSPYILQPVQALAGLGAVGESLNDAIYHHPDADSMGYGALAAHDIYSVGLVLLEIGMWLPLRKFWKQKYETDRHVFVDRLRRTYTPKLASKCGSRYMKIVQQCLGAPSELGDKPGIMDATEYLIDIMKELAACCGLDEAGPPSPLDIEVFEAMLTESRAVQPFSDEVETTSFQGGQRSLPNLPNELSSDSKSSRTAGPISKVRGAGTSRAGQPALRKYPDLPIPQPKLNTWNTSLLPKLQKILTEVLADSPDAASANLMMIGPSPEKAMTTIVVQCCDTGRVHEELKTRLKGKLRLGRGWGLVIVKGDIRRSGKHRSRPTARRAAASSNGQSSVEDRTLQQEYQSLPGAGASIGAFKDGYHLPPVSFGGTVLIDGKPYGMSVHHMLDDASERGSEEDTDSEGDAEPDQNQTQSDLMPHRSSARGDTARMELGAMGTHMGTTLLPVMDELELSDDEGDGEDFQMYDSDSDSDASTIRPDYSMFDDDGNEYWFMEDDESMPDLEDDTSDGSTESDMESIGDKPGFHPDMSDYDDEELCVTQPAIDDVEEDFFPSVEDRDDDHLASHSLGFVHASSGIRRKVYQDVKHEIDWALIRVNKDRCGFTQRNSKVRPQTTPVVQPRLTTVASLASLPNAEVQSMGRTSGSAAGRISSAMSLIKFHGRTSFSQSYTIEGGFGVPGDSGAWVWNTKTHELCGHVLAWADGLKVAFLGPMEVMIEDMKDRLGCESIELMSEAVERELVQRERRLLALQNARQLKAKTQVAEPMMLTVSDQFERAKELEQALKRISLHTPNDSRAASPASQSRNNSGDTILSKVSRCSSASSLYGLSDGEGSGGLRGRAATDSGFRTQKERFDVPSNHIQVPMTRALS